MVIVQAPPGSSLAYTTALAERAEHIIARTRYQWRLRHDGLQLVPALPPTRA
jgi:hypothetical protein